MNENIIDWDCVVENLKKELGVDGLIVLRNLLLLIKQYLNNLKLLLYESIDKELEKFIMKIKIEPLAQLADQVEGYLLQYTDILNQVEGLGYCSGISDFVGKLNKGLTIGVNSLDVFKEVVNKYNFMSTIQDYEKSYIDSLIDYIDIFVETISRNVGV